MACFSVNMNMVERNSGMLTFNLTNLFSFNIDYIHYQNSSEDSLCPLMLNWDYTKDSQTFYCFFFSVILCSLSNNLTYICGHNLSNLIS